MQILETVAGVLLLVVVLLDTFETIVLPRSVARKIRLTRIVYRATWPLWSLIGRKMRPGGAVREPFLGAFGPLSLLFLILVWTVGLMTGFALIQHGLRSPLSQGADTGEASFGTYLYMSGVTLFTLGFGDVTPREGWGRALDVMEAGVGLGFFAIVISYLPVFYQAFSAREVDILLLDARAGSPPSAGELLRRHGSGAGVDGPNMEALTDLLKNFERWAANLLQSYISYPVLAFYRSQHEQMSWLSALTTILDTCALIRVGCLGSDGKNGAGDEPWRRTLAWQAGLTFALCRHVLVDLAYLLNVAPRSPNPDRLPPADWQRLWETLRAAGLPLNGEPTDVARRLADLRREYEPFVAGISRFLILDLSPWLHQETALDNWQTSAWDDNKSAVHF